MDEAPENPNPLQLNPNTLGLPERLAEFSDLEKMAIFYEESSYTVGDEIRTLIKISGDTDSPRLQLSAIKLLHDFRREAMVLAGLIVTAKRSRTTPTGEQQTISAPQVLRHLNPTTQSQTPQSGSTILNMDKDERNHNAKEEKEIDPRTQTGGPEPIINAPPLCEDQLPGLSSRPTG